jgi:transcriptional regulator with XRE-family HTH domain
VTDVPTGDSPPPAKGGDGGTGEDHSRRDDLGQFIRKQREQAKLSLRNLSKIAGVSNPYLSQIERGLRNPSAEILQAIAKALDLSSETLYVRAGILDERKDGDVESSIARDPYLTEHQRATLVEMYRTFRAVSEAARVEAPPAEAEAAKQSGVVDRVIDALSTGGVTDQDIAGTVSDQEDPEEL